MFQNFKQQIARITFVMQKNAMPAVAVMAIGNKLHIIHFS